MLSDPRRYPSGGSSHPLLEPARAQHQYELTRALHELAAADRNLEIGNVLAAAASPLEYARVWHALCAAIENPRDDEAVAPRVFAIPWVIVCGGNAPSTIDCVLPDVGELARVLEQHNVFGPSRNLGLSNVLCAIEALESLSPVEVLHGWENPRVRGVQPAPIHVVRGVEEVHLRFLIGAAVAPAHTPDIVETGANIGAWGTPALRAMGAQIATPNVQILPMPRPPAGLYTAAYIGRRAGLETAFNLYTSNTVRRFRRAVGDPAVTLSSHATGEVRVTLWTPLDDAMVDGFRWPLHPADNLEEIERSITSMLRACRLPEPHVRDSVLPDCTSSGAVLFPSGRGS